jgi:lycopene beta-cyclase
MDASVPQIGGFRFVYVLPWDAHTLLVEDTLYADTPAIDRTALRARIAAYVAARGWQVATILAEEEGALPIPLGGDLEAYLDVSPARVPKVGLRAALYHPTTGYSLPEAVRCAEAIAALPASSLTSAALLAWQRAHSQRTWRRGRFLRLLNRLLFRAARPDERVRVLERFYRLPSGLIARFYAGRLTLGDKLRLLSGRPPVSVLGAARCVLLRRPRPRPASAAWGEPPQ